MFVRIIFLSLVILIFFQRGYSQQYNFKNYSVENGIAQSQVYAMIEDSRGYLWMGTRGGGITRFDGMDFITYSTKDKLCGNYINCIYEDREKILWIGTTNGLSRYDGLHFENFNFPGAPKNISVVSVLQDKNGILWIASNTGVYTFDGTNTTNFPEIKPSEASQFTCFFIDSRNNIWIGKSKGLTRIKKEKGKYVLTEFSKKNGLADNNISSLAEDKNGNLWIGTYGMGLQLFDGENFLKVKGAEALDDKIVLSILPDSHGFIWATTLTDGVYRWNPSDSTILWLKETEGLSNNHVRTVLEDSWGNYWFGTSGGGVSKYTGQNFIHYGKNNGLPGNFIYSVTGNNSDKLWMGCADKGLCVLDSGKIQVLGAKEGFKDVKVKAICPVNDSSLWLGTEGYGLTIFQDSVFTDLVELPAKYIKDLKKDSLGNVWVSAAGAGIYKISPLDSGKYEIKNFNAQNHLASNRINCIHIDKRQRVWIGYEKDGIACMENDSVVGQWKQPDGLVSDGIRCFTEDPYGFLWIGTADAGISQLPLYKIDPEIKNYVALTSQNIYLLLLDNENNLYAGSESGIDKLTLNKERELIELKHYGKQEGFLGIETCQNAAYKDPQGNLWFGTINGITCFNPSYKVSNPFPPKISVVDVSLNSMPLQHTKYSKSMGSWGMILDTISFHYNENRIGFSFTAINLNNPEKVLYSWKLQGLDEAWTLPAIKKDITFSNLPPGEYAFMVKAFNEDMIPSKIAEIPFTIEKPYWQELWFLSASSGMGLMLLFVSFRLRTAQIRKKSERQRKQLEMEKTLIELEQKALRLQMNPHFIFNALNSIQSLILRKDESARYYLAKFSKLMRLTLENSRNAFISLDKEIASLDNYLSLEKFSGGEKFEFKITVGEGLVPEEINIPPMLIQPFAENAVIHGVQHREEKGKIEITFCKKDGYLECSIQDNGIGRVRANEIKSQREQHHKSTALLVTQERLDILNEGEKINSIEIVDLYDESNQPAGTTAIIKMPLLKEYMDRN